MRLINTASLVLGYFSECPTDTYAILSHTWGPDDEELTLDEFVAGEGRHKVGFQKIQMCCEQAQREGLQYAWVDTCCIDKRSSAELSEAINSMFDWYACARVCYVYLADIDHHDELRTGEESRHFLQSRWFTRGWTLQELIAPQTAVFYTKEWKRIGSKSHLARDLQVATGITSEVLQSGSRDSFRRCSVAQRMSWASKRQTTRTEDSAYCLFGLFDVHMPLLYGEGSGAFLRLQEEIIRRTDDQTIFAWTGFQGMSSGLLAPSPAHFVDSADIRIRQNRKLAPHTMTSLGVSIECQLLPCEMNTYLVPLQCERMQGTSFSRQLAIYVCKTSSSLQYRRICFRGLCLDTTSNWDISKARTSTILVPNEDYTLHLKPHAGLPLIRINSNLQVWLFRESQFHTLAQDQSATGLDGPGRPDRSTLDEQQHVAEHSEHDVERAITVQGTSSISNIGPPSWTREQVTQIQFLPRDLEHGVVLVFLQSNRSDSKACHILEFGFDRNFEPVCILRTGPLWLTREEAWSWTYRCFQWLRPYSRYSSTYSMFWITWISCITWILGKVISQRQLPMAKTFWVDEPCECRKTQAHNGCFVSFEGCQICFPERRDESCLRTKFTLFNPFVGIKGDIIKKTQVHHKGYFRSHTSTELAVLPDDGLNWQLNFNERHWISQELIRENEDRSCGYIATQTRPVFFAGLRWIFIAYSIAGTIVFCVAPLFSMILGLEFTLSIFLGLLIIFTTKATKSNEYEIQPERSILREVFAKLRSPVTVEENKDSYSKSRHRLGVPMQSILSELQDEQLQRNDDLFHERHLLRCVGVLSEN